jgi:hypothetical protein
MDSPKPTANLLRLHRALMDGFYVETRFYEPDGSYIDWELTPLEDGNFNLRANPQEVQHDAAAGAYPSWPGKSVDHACEREALLTQLCEILGPDHYVNQLPQPLHQPEDPRVKFHHCLGNFTLELPEGSLAQSLLMIPFVVMLLAVLCMISLIPFLDGWRHGNWLFLIVGISGIAVYGWLLVPIAVDSLCGRAVLNVRASFVTLTRGRAWWRREKQFRWDQVEVLELVVTRTKKFGASTTAQFVFKDGSRVDYATLILKRPFEEAVKVLQSLLA